MACKDCGSTRHTELIGRLSLQLPAGRGSLSKPPVVVTSSVRVCLDCGAVHLALPRAKLRLLQVDAKSQVAA